MTTSVEEINDPVRLAEFRPLGTTCSAQTPGATFFQSCDWLECYWRHYGAGAAVAAAGGARWPAATGILPLVVRTESTRVGRVRVLTYPLHDWGTFYGPIGPDPADDAPGRPAARPPDPPRLGRAGPPLGRPGRLRSGADGAGDAAGRLPSLLPGMGPCGPDRHHGNLAGLLVRAATRSSVTTSIAACAGWPSKGK